MSNNKQKKYPVYRLKTGKTLFSFGDPVGDAPVLFSTVAQWQKDIVESCGMELKDVSNSGEINDKQYFIFDEDIFFTKGFFTSVVDIVNRSHDSQRFCVRENTFNTRFVLPDSIKAEESLKFNFFFIDRDKPATQDTIVEQDVYEHYVHLPHQIVANGKYHYDQCEVFITRIASPFHLLHANMAVNISRTIPLQKMAPKWFIDKYVPVDSKLYFRSIKRLNRIGKGCKIHPSAIIEGSVIGDNTIIGANVIVRLSCIGKNVTLQDNSSVLFSVLGDGTTICNGNCINLSLTYENVFLIHGPYQFSVFGRSCAVFATINCDIRLDEKNIVIPTDAGMLDSGQQLLGIAYGHNSKVGGGNVIAAGRIVPNNRHINPPSSIILKFD